MNLKSTLLGEKRRIHTVYCHQYKIESRQNFQYVGRTHTYIEKLIKKQGNNHKIRMTTNIVRREKDKKWRTYSFIWTEYLKIKANFKHEIGRLD